MLQPEFGLMVEVHRRSVHAVPRQINSHHVSLQTILKRNAKKALPQLIMCTAVRVDHGLLHGRASI